MKKHDLDNIILGYNNFNELDKIITKQDFFICLDKKVYQRHYDKLMPYLMNAKGYLIIEALEANKTEKYLNKIYEMLKENQADRHSYLIAIGGGLVLDLTGYAAATYMRGLELINVPTTLLAAVDSTIGGKVAINAFNTKNLIGTFYQATQIIIDLDFLTTLTTRLFKEGLVELIKHGLLKDESILNTLLNYQNIDELRNDKKMLLNLIKKSLIVKHRIISEDYYDKKIRQQLNLGHSVAHCLELANNNNYYHGECVAIGIVLALSLNNDYQNNDAYKTTLELFRRFACLRDLVAIDFSILKTDKKKKMDKITEIKLIEIGQVAFEQYRLDDLINRYQINYKMLQNELTTTPIEYLFKANYLTGKVNLPPSKSYLHRYLLAAMLAKDVTILTNVTSLCDDVITSIDVLKNFNCQVTYQDHKLIIDSRYLTYQNNLKLNMNESASTLRIYLPSLLNLVSDLTITGLNQLPNRSLEPYFSIFKDNEITMQKLIKDKNLPLYLSGQLKQKKYYLTGLVSSQFISGLLFALPLLKHDSTIIIKDSLSSLDYVTMTIETLKNFNIIINHSPDYLTFQIKGNQSYQSKHSYNIEQDYSAKSYFDFLNLLNNNLTFNEDSQQTLQGDARITQIIKNKQTEIDLTNLIDGAPLLALYSTINGGTLLNTERLKDKESNRLLAITDFLSAMSIDFQEINNNLIIKKGIIKGSKNKTHNDHRIAMTLIVASALCQEAIILNEIKSIDKSFPDFINEFIKIGGSYDEK
ncbi:iron-containing alcohol dehydrogenase [Erysipelotrichaceae bacterium OttesenSCG-928-M19]|nr:iron-containing alcohol dehydrogenase [Erysipelotrichaceae bacterium OttesenSCG-928-M19]